MVGLFASGALKSSSAALIIVNVLPLPWVCQTSPRLRFGCSALSTTLSTAVA